MLFYVKMLLNYMSFRRHIIVTMVTLCSKKAPELPEALDHYIPDYADRGMEKRSGDPRQSDTVLA